MNLSLRDKMFLNTILPLLVGFLFYFRDNYFDFIINLLFEGLIVFALITYFEYKDSKLKVIGEKVKGQWDK